MREYYYVSGQAESNRHYTHPKGTDYHYPMARDAYSPYQLAA